MPDTIAFIGTGTMGAPMAANLLIAALVRSQMQAARRAGLGGLDVSAIWLQATGDRHDETQSSTTASTSTTGATAAGTATAKVKQC